VDISVRTETFGGDDQSWLGSAHGTSSGRTVTLDKSKFTSGTHYPNGYLRSGTPLGKVTASGKYGPYDDAAVDGRQTLVGFLLTPQSTTSGGNDLVAPLFEHGAVVEANLPIAIDANGKTDVAGRIWFR
jgi:hypothetical protein